MQDRGVGQREEDDRDSDPPGGAAGVLDERTLRELERLARSRPRSSRGVAVKISAIRTLERVGRRRLKREIPPMPDGWHPHPQDRWGELDADDSEATRERWWAALNR